MRKQVSLKPQDVLVVLKLALHEATELRQKDIADQLGLSQAEVANSLLRLKACNLILPDKSVIKKNLRSFLVHGLPYVFPAVIGAVQRGIPTAHSGPGLKEHISSVESDVYVWPDAHGSARGHSVSPLYSSVPTAAQNDPQLYKLLSLIDSLRVGRGREKKMAENQLMESFDK